MRVGKELADVYKRVHVRVCWRMTVVGGIPVGSKVVRTTSGGKVEPPDLGEREVVIAW